MDRRSTEAVSVLKLTYPNTGGVTRTKLDVRQFRKLATLNGIPTISAQTGANNIDQRRSNMRVDQLIATGNKVS